MKLIAKIEGNTFDDLVLALDEIRRLTADEYTSGSDSNDTGSYNFTIEGPSLDLDDKED